ncbi:MAG: putative sulfate exporter family transporter [bacterium]|nr:putative sulfate exporter family transporter [bacterium]
MDAKEHGLTLRSLPARPLDRVATALEPLWKLEDWWSNWLGTALMVAACTGLVLKVPRPAAWSGNPLAALPVTALPALLALGAGLALLTAAAVAATRREATPYLAAFPALFGLAVLSYVIGSQSTLAHYGFNYVIWALLLGLAISNTVGVPRWLAPALRGELFIKTGLVLLGAEILFPRVMALGVRGLGVAWLVTPVVLGFMYFFGTRVLRIESKPLVATVAAATSVCGVSAAIATGAATRAKKEEISFAISLSLFFTVLMMLGMPLIIKAIGLTPVVGGALIGGTVDSTGAVVAAAALLGAEAMQVAALIKMIQNVLIGLVAFTFAALWVTRLERPAAGTSGPAEIWRRLPKFIVGFLLASVVFSFLLLPGMGEAAVSGVLKVTSRLRDWLFCLAFVCIGLESRFANMAGTVRGGRPVVLYVVGQTFNILLTLLAAWLFFGGGWLPVAG